MTRRFEVRAHGTCPRRETFSGATGFLAMACILELKLPLGMAPPRTVTPAPG